MTQTDYPTVSADFLLEELKKSKKIDPASHMTAGSTHLFKLKGTKPIYKNTVSFRANSDGEVSYMEASAVAIIHKFMGKLTTYLKEERNWNEGEFM